MALGHLKEIAPGTPATHIFQGEGAGDRAKGILGDPNSLPAERIDAAATAVALWRVKNLRVALDDASQVPPVIPQLIGEIDGHMRGDDHACRTEDWEATRGWRN